MVKANLALEQHLGRQRYLIAGVDEVGRGSLAGPVVAAAVILPENFAVQGIKDSKLISAPSRQKLARLIMSSAVVGLGMATVEEISQLNILQASLLAMTRAIKNLPMPPDRLIIDGNFAPLDYKSISLVQPKADQTSLSVAAASICAKCWRDGVMVGLAKLFPEYCWCANVGYGTPQHKEAIKNYGITKWHRATFAPCRNSFPR